MHCHPWLRCWLQPLLVPCHTWLHQRKEWRLPDVLLCFACFTCAIASRSAQLCQLMVSVLDAVAADDAATGGGAVSGLYRSCVQTLRNVAVCCKSFLAKSVLSKAAALLDE